MALILSAVLVLAFTGCAQEEKEHVPNEFPLSEEKIDQILADNGLPFEAGVQTVLTHTIVVNPQNPETKVFDSYSHILYVKDENHYGQAGIQFISNDIGNSVSFTYVISIPGTIPATRYNRNENATKQAVTTTCDLYGGFENKDKLADKIEKAIKKDKVRRYEDRIVWYEKYENTHVLVNFTEIANGTETELNFYNIMIQDDSFFKTELENSIASGQIWATELYNEVYG